MTVEVQQGAIAPLEFELRNRSGALTDADAGAVTLTLVEIDEDAVAGFPVDEDDIEHVSTGRYRYQWSVPTDQDLGAYTAVWTCLVATEAVEATEPVVVLPPSVPASPFVTVAQVRALVKTMLSDEQLEDVILREEAILSAEIGPLGGARTETRVITDRTLRHPVRTRRPADSLTVTEANATVADIRLGADGRTIYRLTSSGWAVQSWAGVVEVTYTPSDAAKVTTWVIELVRARLAKTGYLDEPNAEQIDYDATLSAAVAEILSRGPRGRGGLTSVRLSSNAGASRWIGTVRP